MVHDRLVQARIVKRRNLFQQLIVRVDQPLFSLLPRRFAEVVQRHPVFTVRQLRRIAIKPS